MIILQLTIKTSSEMETNPGCPPVPMKRNMASPNHQADKTKPMQALRQPLLIALAVGLALISVHWLGPKVTSNKLYWSVFAPVSGAYIAASFLHALGCPDSPKVIMVFSALFWHCLVTLPAAWMWKFSAGHKTLCILGVVLAWGLANLGTLISGLE